MSEHITQILTQAKPILEPIFKELRPYVKQYFPSQLIQYGRQLYTRPVFDQIVLNLDLFSPESSELVNLFISKTLSLGIVGFGGLVKFPQIINILSNGSTRGLSFISVLLDTLSQLITVAYNFRKGNDFFTFGETALVSFQNVLILILIFIYTNGWFKYLNGFLGLLAISVYSLFGAPHKENVGVLSNESVAELFKYTIPLLVLSKLPQIFNNFKNKSTGTLSGISVGAGLLGNAVRLFTLLAGGVKDNLILVGFGISVLLNFILFTQVLVFGNKPVVSKQKKQN